MKTLFKKLLPIFLAATMGLSAFAFAGCTKVLYGNMPVDDGSKSLSVPSTYVNLSDGEDRQYIVFMLLIL